MPRAKKEGAYISCKIKMDIYDRLCSYSDTTMIPKTAIVERALEEYLNRQEPTAIRANSYNK